MWKIFSFFIKIILSLRSFMVELLVLQIVEGAQFIIGTKQVRTAIMWEESVVE
jgi:hypothetical protein